MIFEHSKQLTPTSPPLPTIIPSALPTVEEKDQKRKREMTELETNAPRSPSPSPSPSHSVPRFQLHPSTPELSPNLVKRMEKDTCFRCHQQGHWSWYCPLKSPNNTNFSPNHNHSPVSSKLIQCRCGHGFCEIKTARNEKNQGRKYFACPIKRGARCKDFIKWCDDPIDESDLQPPLLKYPQCECGAGVCRRMKETDGFKYYFACPIKQDHGSCGYRVSEDELLNNTSIVSVQQSRQTSLHEFWGGCQSDTTDNDLGNDLGEGIDLLLTTKRLRITDKSEHPSPMAVSEIPEEKDGESPIEAANSQHIGFPVCDIADDDVEGWEALEAAEALSSSRLSTPSSIRLRQSLFERDLFAADASFGIFPSFDSIGVPEQASTPNGDLAVKSVSKHDQFPTISPVGASKDVISPNKSPMSKAQRLREVALFTQKQLLKVLENLDPHQHESMREAAKATFVVLDHLGIECKQFSDHIWDFINLVSSMAEIDKSMENSPTLEEFLEGEKVRLAHIRDDCTKTEALFETFNQQRKLLSEEVSQIEAMLHKKQDELKSCELETVKIETQLGDLKRSMLEVDLSLKDRVRQAEVAREQSEQRQTKQSAAKTALEKAKRELEN